LLNSMDLKMKKLLKTGTTVKTCKLEEEGNDSELRVKVQTEKDVQKEDYCP